MYLLRACCIPGSVCWEPGIIARQTKAAFLEIETWMPGTREPRRAKMRLSQTEMVASIHGRNVTWKLSRGWDSGCHVGVAFHLPLGHDPQWFRYGAHPSLMQ